MKSEQVADAARKFDALQYPGNRAVPEPAGFPYLYAGEIPWSAHYGDGFRQADREGKADRRRAFSGIWGSEEGAKGKGITVEVPVCCFEWERHHSERNQVSGAVLPAPEVCDVMELSNRQGEWDLRDPHNRLATLYRVFGDNKSARRTDLAYMRKDLLLSYLARTGQRLMWFVWGERTLDYTALEKSMEELQPVFRNYEHIHARWRVLDPAAQDGVLRSEEAGVSFAACRTTGNRTD